jgi:hypothetical protein
VLRGFIKSVPMTPMFKAMNASQRDVFWALVHIADRDRNIKQWEWQGEVIMCKPGQFVTSLRDIKKLCAKDTTPQNIRTALKKLETWSFLTNESTKLGRLITITNPTDYQPDEKKLTKKLTKHQQSTNKATGKKLGASNGDGKILFGEYVRLTEKEYVTILKSFGKHKFEWCMDELDHYIGANPVQRGKKYTSHRHVLYGWVSAKYLEKFPPQNETDARSIYGDLNDA